LAAPWPAADSKRPFDSQPASWEGTGGRVVLHDNQPGGRSQIFAETAACHPWHFRRPTRRFRDFHAIDVRVNHRDVVVIRIRYGPRP
jgi:hypothetical protein